MSDSTPQAVTLQVVQGRVMTASLDVAQQFGKQHKNVLRQIRELLEAEPEWCRRNFEPTSIPVAQPQGGLRSEPAYHITRDGFSLLAMGFTGKRALLWKVRYIEAFNAMEASLLAQPNREQALKANPESCQDQEFFVRLFYALGKDMGRATTLYVLLLHGAHREWLPLSVREMAALVGNVVGRATFHHAVNRLLEDGLLLARRERSRRTWYFVPEQPLLGRLQALPGAPGLRPGLPQIGYAGKSKRLN